VAEARQALAAAVLAYDWRANQARDKHGWAADHICHVLRREAEGLILTNLPAFLEGKYQPQDNDERLALLGVCQFTNRTRASAGLYAEAFAAVPLLAEDLGTGHRYNAARAAALAGRGLGADAASLGQEERMRWRKQARAWLRADLVAWSKKLDGGNTADRLLVQKTCTHWRTDPDLAGLRDMSALNELSTEEREECQALWNEVAAVLNRAQPIR
jgi:serine/threonine-protein kinase